MALPLCVQCQRASVKRAGKRFCSWDCFNASRRKPLKRCAACPAPVNTRHSTYCKACADARWVSSRKANLAKGSAVLKAQRIERLKNKLSKLNTRSGIWRTAYLAGYQACWQSFQRAILRGDILVVRERKIGKREAA